MKKKFEMKLEGSSREEMIEARDAAMAFVLRNPSIKAYRELECWVTLDNEYRKHISEEGCTDGRYSWCDGAVKANEWVEAVNRELTRPVVIEEFTISAKVEYVK